MIGTLDVTHRLIFTIPSVIQINSIRSIRLRFNLGKPRMLAVNACKRICILTRLN